MIEAAEEVVKVSLALSAADADPRSPTPYDTSSDGHE